MRGKLKLKLSLAVTTSTVDYPTVCPEIKKRRVSGRIEEMITKLEVGRVGGDSSVMPDREGDNHIDYFWKKELRKIKRNTVQKLVSEIEKGQKTDQYFE